MKNLSRIANEEFPTWNKIIIPNDELSDYCQKKRVVVFEHPTEFLGEYTIFENRDCIILDPDLDRGLKEWVFPHECGHFIYHHPYEQQFGYKENLFMAKLDYEADFFATIAKIPLSLLKKKTIWEIADEYGYPIEMVRLREHYCDRYKI